MVAGTATTMAQLLVGRVLQGAAAGGLTVAVFVLISVVYPQRVQPAVFGLMSSAWVLPALIGPPVAGLLTDLLSWHWVFLGLVPFVLVAVALVVPAVRRLTAGRSPGRTGRPQRRGGDRRARGGGAGCPGLSWAAQHSSPVRPASSRWSRRPAGAGAAPAAAGPVWSWPGAGCPRWSPPAACCRSSPRRPTSR